ncbi:MAG: hypothetical protein O2780_19485 [Proteobacteria bacterium]|nr:hypothetical protein [Pseudomonadota bacterium]
MSTYSHDDGVPDTGTLKAVIKVVLILAAVGALSGCVSTQQLHPFPSAVMERLDSQTCDCVLIEIVGGSKGYEKGYVVGSSGERSDFRIAAEALFVDEERLKVNSTVLRFRAARQRANLSAPFDQARYVLSATWDGRDSGLTIVQQTADGPEWVGSLTWNDAGHVAGEVFGRRLSVREHRVWSHSAERTILDGQTVWHQYPEGGHRVVADDRGHLMDLYEGAVPGRLMGLDVFDQPRLIAYLPTAGDGDLERDLILFQIAAFYLEGFDDHVSQLPDCLKKDRSVAPSDCPGEIVRH